MAEKTAESISSGIPILTLAVVLASLSASIWPDLSPIFIFDREAISAGELWRLFTCHVVHFSPLHVTYNVIVFGISGYLIEKNDARRFGLLLFFLASAVSLTLFVLKPGMAWYGGLSGIACGTLYFFALTEMKKNRSWHSPGLLIVLLVPVKILVEICTSSSLLPYLHQQSFVPMHTGHIAGCLTAVCFYLARSKKEELT